jgi:hypothetical protein
MAPSGLINVWSTLNLVIFMGDGSITAMEDHEDPELPDVPRKSGTIANAEDLVLKGNLTMEGSATVRAAPEPRFDRVHQLLSTSCHTTRGGQHLASAKSGRITTSCRRRFAPTLKQCQSKGEFPAGHRNRGGIVKLRCLAPNGGNGRKRSVHIELRRRG